METIGKFVTTMCAAVVLLFLALVLGTTIGAVSGWVVGLFFGDTILTVFAVFGIKGLSMWQIGAFLGFVGGFFRPAVTSSK